MKNLTIIILSLLLSSCLDIKSDTDLEEKHHSKESINLISLGGPIEIDPVFPDGNQNVIGYFKNKLNLDGIGILKFRFTVDSLGLPHSTIIMKNSTELKTKFLILKLTEILDSMPNWKPGKVNDKNVSVEFFIPLNYERK